MLICSEHLQEILSMEKCKYKKEKIITLLELIVIVFLYGNPLCNRFLHTLLSKSDKKFKKNNFLRFCGTKTFFNFDFCFVFDMC